MGGVPPAWPSVHAARIMRRYGYDEYAAGLWIINKHGDLTNGQTLSEFWQGVWGALIFLSLQKLPITEFGGCRDSRRDGCLRRSCDGKHNHGPGMV